MIVSDGLTRIENAVKRAFPRALHQLCTVHFKRNALGMVAKKDRAQLKADLDAVFLMENTDMMPIEAYENLKRLTRTLRGLRRNGLVSIPLSKGYPMKGVLLISLIFVFQLICVVCYAQLIG